ncbi:hypothetical protein Tco_0194103 [Tanacetum coccineum]
MIACYVFFCKKVPDNHNHLFFECDFPKKIWCNLKDMVKLDRARSDILCFFLKRPINKSIWSILQRSMEDVCCLIKDVVRLRVLSLSLNPSAQVYEAADIWNFHVCNEKGYKKVKFIAR